MKKRVLSLVMALAMCLGLCATAMAEPAAGEIGSTIISFSDETGLTCSLSLSNPIVGKEEVADPDFFSNGASSAVYVVPAGTTITPVVPAGAAADGSVINLADGTWIRFSTWRRDFNDDGSGTYTWWPDDFINGSFLLTGETYWKIECEHSWSVYSSGASGAGLDGVTSTIYILCAAAGAANPVTISDGGLSVTISDVISEEDVTIVCVPDGEETAETWTLHVYHVASDAVYTAQNNAFGGFSGAAAVFYLVENGMLTGGLGAGDGGDYWEAGVECPYVNLLDSWTHATLGEGDNPITLSHLTVSLNGDESLKVEFYYVEDDGKFSFADYLGSGDQPPAEESPAAPAAQPLTPFSDVPAGCWYENEVKWTYEQGIAGGTGPASFSPGETCSVAQILTFLYRAAGSPQTTAANPFSNVYESDYYYSAAIWAYENHMVDAGVFDGAADCTRAMTVVYLWRAAGCPGAEMSEFTDVPSGAYYAPAVNWAVENGVTNGDGPGTFSPDKTCTRAQIATFLYRAFA